MKKSACENDITNVTTTEMITPRVPDPLESAKNESSEITVNQWPAEIKSQIGDSH